MSLAREFEQQTENAARVREVEDLAGAGNVTTGDAIGAAMEVNMALDDKYKANGNDTYAEFGAPALEAYSVYWEVKSETDGVYRMHNPLLYSWDGEKFKKLSVELPKDGLTDGEWGLDFDGKKFRIKENGAVKIVKISLGGDPEVEQYHTGVLVLGDADEPLSSESSSPFSNSSWMSSSEFSSMSSASSESPSASVPSESPSQSQSVTSESQSAQSGSQSPGSQSPGSQSAPSPGSWSTSTHSQQSQSEDSEGTMDVVVSVHFKGNELYYYTQKVQVVQILGKKQKHSITRAEPHCCS